MRHITRLLSFCNVESTINAEDRAYLSFKTKNDEIIKTYIGTLGDLLNTIDVIGNISTVPPEKLKFYDNVFIPLWNDVNTLQENLTDTQHNILEKKGVLSSDLVDKYTSVFKKPITQKQISENYLKPLVDEGMIQTEPDPDNKSRYHYYPSNGISIHNLEELKSTLIDKSTLENNLKDAVISRLKQFIQVSTDFRKSNVIFYKDGFLNLDGLCSEIGRH